MYRNRGPFPGFEQRSSSEAITHMIEPPALPLDARTSANAQHTHLSPQLLSLFLAVPPSSFVLYPCTTLFNRNVSLKKRIFQSPAGKPAGVKNRFPEQKNEKNASSSALDLFWLVKQ
ncbi:Hypothetical protein NTJ_06814 [Nesidiocoris tenuis]|uniref:Uncharacterized protein n=1 Tax=Nesidiocoris tenuis TaxID=355587 RepID=A0ABN7ASU3_9HEMI|nr:Hypothetical protein NTJ_06814 [Nesidiocoris tenuis]